MAALKNTYGFPGFFLLLILLGVTFSGMLLHGFHNKWTPFAIFTMGFLLSLGNGVFLYWLCRQNTYRFGHDLLARKFKVIPLLLFVTGLLLMMASLYRWA